METKDLFLSTNGTRTLRTKAFVGPGAKRRHRQTGVRNVL